ncbi:MAG: BrnT family toxin [Burkholderiaceae bacterium]
MINFSAITGFDWDEGNARKSERKHAVMQGEAEEVFFNQPLLTVPDDLHSDVENRFHALGVTHAGRLLNITFTLRANGTLIRVISARSMSRKERQCYEQAF